MLRLKQIIKEEIKRALLESQQTEVTSLEIATEPDWETEYYIRGTIQGTEGGEPFTRGFESYVTGARKFSNFNDVIEQISYSMDFSEELSTALQRYAAANQSKIAGFLREINQTADEMQRSHEQNYDY